MDKIQDRLQVLQSQNIQKKIYCDSIQKTTFSQQEKIQIQKPIQIHGRIIRNNISSLQLTELLNEVIIDRGGPIGPIWNTNTPTTLVEAIDRLASAIKNIGVTNANEDIVKLFENGIPIESEIQNIGGGDSELPAK